VAKRPSKKRSAAAKRIDEALAILASLNVPREQQNERSALVLLALLGMTPRKSWSAATDPMLGITEMMNVFRNQFGKEYAPNTRETVWLVLIEAVTSHGPIGIKRHNELKALFGTARSGLVFVTALLTRRAMTKYLGEIAWETEVWIAEAPSHIIHFNGERFLGPYE